MKFGRQAGKKAIFHTEAFRKNIFSVRELSGERGSFFEKGARRSSGFLLFRKVFWGLPGAHFGAPRSAFWSSQERVLPHFHGGVGGFRTKCIGCV